MRPYKRIAAFFCVLAFFLLFSFALADSSPGPTATPQPVSISDRGSDPPDVILHMVEVAKAEWEHLRGKKLPRSNKYTKWVNNSAWGWCAGFTSWCAMEAGVPRASLSAILKTREGETEEPVYTCTAVSPGKQLRAYQHMHRTTMIPRTGFLVIYGDRYNYVSHIGLVCDVRLLENGKYRLTTIEGNMKSTVRMFVADYEPVDVYYEQHHKPTVSNLTAVPDDERDSEESRMFTYRLRVSDTDGSDWYVTCFLMTWLPGDDFLVTD